MCYPELSGTYMLGLSRNTWFGIGGVLLAVVLFLGFTGDDEPKDDDAKAADAKNKNKRKGKKRRDKAAVVEAGGLGIAKVCAKLDCSDAQLESFKAMVKDHRTQTSAQRRALAAAHAKIAAELAEETLDTAALDLAFAEAAEQRAAIDENARAVLEAMHGKLAGPQREALAKLVARHGPTMLLARPADGGNASKVSKPGRPGKKGRRKGRKNETKSMQFQMRKTVAEGGTEGDGLSAPPIQMPKRSGAARTAPDQDGEEFDDEDAPEEDALDDEPQE